MIGTLRYSGVLAVATIWSLSIRLVNAAKPESMQAQTVATTAAVPAEPGRSDEIRCGVDAAQLAQCQAACASGGMAIRNFCNTLPDPRMRGPCFALELGSEVACKSWCYWHFGK